MRHRLAVAGILVVLVLALLPHRRPAPDSGRPIVPAPVRRDPAPVATDHPDPAWASHASRLSEACGLDVSATCTEAGCAALATTPDLDRFSGWVRLSWDHPGLVAATVLGDLGLVPRTALPCDAAIAAMSGDTRVTIGDGPSGTWLACVWTASGTADESAPCASLAAAAGLPWHVSDPTRRW